MNNLHCHIYLYILSLCIHKQTKIKK